jgi:hypothetical protein
MEVVEREIGCFRSRTLLFWILDFALLLFYFLLIIFTSSYWSLESIFVLVLYLVDG